MSESNKESKYSRVDCMLVCLGAGLILASLILYVFSLIQRLGKSAATATFDTTDGMILGTGIALLVWPSVSSLKVANWLEISRLRNDVGRIKNEVEATAALAMEAKAEAVSHSAIVPLGVRLPELGGLQKTMHTGDAEKASQTKEVPASSTEPATEDPNKGAFEGQFLSNNRRLSATVTASSDPDWFMIELQVKSTSAANPLQKMVQFHLHPTFKPNDIVGVMPIEGVARLRIWAWGAFTVGAVCDGGATRLELDLSDESAVPGAPDKFRGR